MDRQERPTQDNDLVFTAYVFLISFILHLLLYYSGNGRISSSYTFPSQKAAEN